MTVKATGRRTFFHQRGANAWVGPEHFDFGASRAKHFHLGYLLLLDRLDQPDPEHGTVAAHLLKKALDAGFKTSIDVVSEDSDRFPAIVCPALKWTDYAILNEFEAERTTGRSIRTEKGIDFAQLHAAARDLLAAGVREWVVIHFPEGAIAAHRDRDILFQGSARIPQHDIIGTSGAGDAFGAGLLYGLHQEESMEECLLYAVCVATACLTQATCSGGIHSLSKCLEFGRALGFRAQPSSLPLTLV
jgi:sugar/nucleoside kinase (ribokinase family)